MAQPSKLKVKRGGTATLKLAASLNEGFHANSHTPSEDYLIPLKLTWAPGVLEPVDVDYPKGHLQKYSFSEKPLSVISGAMQISTKFKASSSAPAGPSTMTGKIRFQACNDSACFAPKTVEVKVTVDVE